MTGVRIAKGADRAAALRRLALSWGDPILVRGETHALADCEIFVAGDMEGLAAISTRDAPIAELVAINAFEPGQGIGAALLGAIIRRLAGFTALRFYQRHGFRLAEIRFGVVDAARRLEPSIPLLGDHGVPIHDEIELVLDLGRASPPAMSQFSK
jgi:GNAT superfamily N-acetyltransferase